MNATSDSVSPSACDGGSSVLQWVALGWVVISELLPLVDDDKLPANGLLHGVLALLKSERVRQFFTQRGGGHGGSETADLPF